MNKKNTILSSILMFSCGGLMAQFNHGWHSTIESVGHNDYRSIVVNDYLFGVGRVENNGSVLYPTSQQSQTTFGGSDFQISKYSLAGNLIWSHVIGGSLDEQYVNASSDENGHLYVCGFFESTFDADHGPGTVTLTNSGERDGIVSKYDENTGNLIWAKAISGANNIQAEGITVLSDGIVIIGRFNGTADFDPGVGISNLTASGNNDIFALKIDEDGQFVWAKNYGGTGGDIAWGIDSDQNNNVVITGVFKNTIQFDSNLSSSSHTSSGGNDIFILKLNSSGNYLWSKSFGSTGDDTGTSISCDEAGNIFTSGYFELTVDFDPGPQQQNLTALSSQDGFLLKLLTDGTFQWVKQFGGSIGDDKGKAVGFDSFDRIYLALVFEGTISVNGINYASLGNQDCLIVRLNQAGTIDFSASFGGTDDDYINAVVCDSNNNVYVDGKYGQTMDVDPTDNSINITSAGQFDGYIVKWDYDVCVDFPVDNTVTQQGLVLTSNQTDAEYQWVNCPSMIPIPNQTAISYTPSQNGSYAVQISNDHGCSLTSDCISIQTIGIEELEKSMVVFPNPFQETIHVMGDAEVIRLFDSAGKIQPVSITKTSDLNLIVPDFALSKGIYFLHVDNSIIKLVH